MLRKIEKKKERLISVAAIIFPLFFQVHAVIGVLSDDTDPMVSVMKLEKAPQESYADIGGLDQQIQEIKVRFFSHLFPVQISVYTMCIA